MACCIIAALLFGRMCLVTRWAYRKLLGRSQPEPTVTMPMPTRSLSAATGNDAEATPVGGR